MPEMDTRQMIDMQRQDWNRVAPAWEKWDAHLERNMAFLNYRLVGDARLRAGQRVLDLGCGTGYPALLAAHAVGEQGSVVGLDLAEAMLAAARRKAETLGLANVTFQTGDVTTMPFESASFAAVISRFCLMFLPDVPKAVGEIARVLKPGGYLAVAVWSLPDRNPFISLPLGVIKNFIVLPPPDPEQPGIFRLAKAGDLSGIATRAGLHSLADEEVTAEFRYDSPEEYLTSLMEMAAPLQSLFARLTPAQTREAESQITRAVGQYRKGKEIVLPMAIRVVAARKP